MTRRRLFKILLAAGAGAVAALLLLFVLSVVNAGQGFLTSTATNGAGWTVPLLTGLIAGALAWSLTRVPRMSGRLSARSSRVACPECGGAVRADWRLCPHCGARL